MTAIPSHTDETSRRGPAAFAGAGIGLLLGVAVGLSTSPVVATLVGAVAALLSAVLGFAMSGGERHDPSRQWAAGALGLSCTIGLLAGVAVRANDVLSPSPSREIAKWTAAHFDTTTARAIVAYRLAGIIPDGRQVNSSTAARGASILFGVTPEACEQLDPSTLGDVESLRIAFHAKGGRWRELADAVASLDPMAQQRVLTTGWRLACARR